MERDLGVGGFTVVLVSEAAADAENSRGQLALAERPARHIHLVDALTLMVKSPATSDGRSVGRVEHHACPGAKVRIVRVPHAIKSNTYFCGDLG